MHAGTPTLSLRISEENAKMYITNTITFDENIEYEIYFITKL